MPELQDEMNNDLGKIFAWLCSNKLSLSILKTEFMVIGSRQRIATLEGDIPFKVYVIRLPVMYTLLEGLILSLGNLVTLYRSIVEP